MNRKRISSTHSRIIYLAILGLFVGSGLGLYVDSREALAGGVPASTPELIAKGKASYTTNCTVCHGDSGDGNGPAGASMNPKPRHLVKDKFKKGDKAPNIFKSITDGLPGTAMAGFKHLSEEDRWGITYYLQDMRKKK